MEIGRRVTRRKKREREEKGLKVGRRVRRKRREREDGERRKVKRNEEGNTESKNMTQN